mmetsp:Transcript_133636/g.266625  ORF Transcript_133636/g.266625 Transcript_133636/m.266625 type:complete len:225 (+) Transcript_133636:692-1366(+)
MNPPTLRATVTVRATPSQCAWKAAAVKPSVLARCSNTNFLHPGALPSILCNCAADVGVSNDPSGTVADSTTGSARLTSGVWASTSVLASTLALLDGGGINLSNEHNAPKPHRSFVAIDSSGLGISADGPIRQTSPSQSSNARNCTGSKSRKIRPASSRGSALSQRPLKSSASREWPRHVSVFRVVAKDESPPTLSRSTSNKLDGDPSTPTVRSLSVASARTSST